MKLSFREWNARQKILRHDLEKSENFHQAISLFIEQHEMVQSAQMVSSEFASFADEIWKDWTEENIRRIPKSEDYSIAWVIWHMARIEDITMNMLVAGIPQLAEEEKWFSQIKSSMVDTGNAMTREAVHRMSQVVDIDALRAYRIAVGRRTRSIVKEITLEQLHQKVTPERIERILDSGAVVMGARDIVDYWSRRTVAGLLMMPPTRHNMVHINQALRIRKRKD